MLTYRLGSLVLVFAASLMLWGCGNKDTGQSDVKIDAAKVQQDLDAQIKAVESNPNIPAGQKQAIIGRIKNQGGAAGRAAGGGK